MLAILGYLLNLLFPTECLICKKVGPDICGTCLHNFETHKPQNFSWIISLWNYRDPNVEKIMRHIKNSPNKRVARILVEEILTKIETIDTLLFSSLFRDNQIFNHSTTQSPQIIKVTRGLPEIILIPIPIGRKRFRERGYNQAELIARPLGYLLGIRVETSVLKKIKHTHKQGTAKSKHDRLINIQDSFGVINAEKIIGRDVIIIDDITTSGATLAEARKALLEAEARSVFAITIAN